MNHQESKIQIACVRWFAYQYPALFPLFFAVPNGGKRLLTEAKIMKAEGVKSGVSDLLLLHPNKDYSFLAIEMKTKKGRQNDNQKKWQAEIEKTGVGKYVICRSTEQFIKEVTSYLKNAQKF
ncbi:VRR-NUC domain-containing protein [Elizabethkingia anophelis]|uniref:VRR-NUC domain n=1 Tax=Elizabethkingia anophelis TaxID=1117645 RepID=A0A7Z7LU27_9FLAO|nr:VRR-NUC domain-containing protein [Elizabethkingia anophelis]EJC8061956.1 VRR-NUC domain-containing protein [Elizabethkingia anophelis]MCL1640046.1 VRR-NUC domain-containing protein [Elizabethkingia anophelis]MCL1646563.1 VRR-NUC domain-containing protein [Elizabethkingia anophelis]MCT3800603.1 VRR-NUC domain-containing protein [Elizabethkingia anophelis]MCT3926927.1 VRR-NUC domain-containing protein [Elizabethkingia anophelis]